MTEARTLDDPEEPILLAAQQELERRYRQADADGDWRERWFLTELVDVADYTRRLALPTTSAHYRAEKSGDLAAAADRVQKVALVGFAGWPENTDPEDSRTHPTEQAIHDAFEILGNVRAAVRTGAWLAASGTGAELYESDAQAIRRAAREFSAWADRLADTAVADPAE
jgi:hypothetical protein